MTESHGTEPTLTLLAILTNRQKCELHNVLDRFEDIKLDLKKRKLKNADIIKEINELLSKRSPAFLIKENEQVSTSSEKHSGSVKSPEHKKPLSKMLPSSSTVDLSLS